MMSNQVLSGLIVVNIFVIILIVSTHVRNKTNLKKKIKDTNLDQFQNNVIEYIWKTHKQNVENANGKFDSETKSIVLIEGRKHHLLEASLRNLNHILKDWDIHVIHTLSNKNFVDEIIKKIGLKKVNKTCLQVEKFGVDDFSTLLGTPNFWENIVTTDRILISQTDAWLCHNSSHKIEEFFIYDYVGAPWASNINLSNPSESNVNLVGNCGLCLCKRLKVLEKVKKHPFSVFVQNTGTYAVDIYFSKIITNTAPAEIAKAFSVETIWYDRPIGVHKPFGMNKNILQSLNSHCEGVLTLLQY